MTSGIWYSFWQYVIDVHSHYFLGQRHSSGPYRLGQAYHDVLSVAHPDFSIDVYAANKSPYHDDRKISEFLKWISYCWYDYFSEPPSQTVLVPQYGNSIPTIYTPTTGGEE